MARSVLTLQPCTAAHTAGGGPPEGAAGEGGDGHSLEGEGGDGHSLEAEGGQEQDGQGTVPEEAEGDQAAVQTWLYCEGSRV